MSTKGTATYLAIAFVIGYAVQIPGYRVGLLRLGEGAGLFHYLAFLLVMYIPALAAWAASRVEGREEVTGGAYWPLPVGKTLLWVVATPVIFAVIHGITAVFGWSTLSTAMGGLVPGINEALRGMGQPEMTPEVQRILPWAATIAGIPITMLLGATVFTAVALGGELGWRGCLLPRIDRVGRQPANALAGLLWGLWLLPSLFGWLKLNPHLADSTAGYVVRFLVMAVLLGIVLGEVWRRTRHMLLTAVVLGAFLGQQFGQIVWPNLFENPQRPWAGGLGVVALVVWACVALAMVLTAPRGEAKA